MSPGLAIVTGASSGIGAATCAQLARDGFRVVSVDVSGTPAFRLDVRDDAAVRSMVAGLGPVAALVNVAGIGVAAKLHETTDDDWDRIVGVNLTGMFYLCRAVLPVMVAAGGGTIVNVSSVAGLVGVRERAAYCASKAAVIGLTRSITVDYAGAGIRCNAICPGTVDTEWIGKILADAPDPAAARAAMVARQLDGRMGTPEEIAAGIAFLLSDGARFVNGSAFVMDGGMTAV